MDQFKIRATSFYWIDGDADDPEDLCLHGHVVAEIGGVRLEDDCTVGAVFAENVDGGSYPSRG